MTPEEKYDALGELASEYENCERCGLCDPDRRSRHNVVFGEGNPNARLLVVGEAPGRQEDLQGRPFVGRAGELFDKLLETFHMGRDEIFITNVVCCRPTEDGDPNKNRKPTKEEIAACSERLHKTIEIVDPHVVLLLGASALKALTKEKRGISTIAKKPEFPRLEVITQGVFGPVTRMGFATFHPSYLLRNDSMLVGSDMHLSYQCWEKVIKIVDKIGEVYHGEVPPFRGLEDD